MNQRIWIVGGSSGIGLELVKLWLASNHQVIASARGATRCESLLKLKQTYQERLHLVDIDVTFKDSIKSATQEAWERFGGIDIWFYNAAVYEPTKLKSLMLSDYEMMIEVNYLGAVRVANALLPLVSAPNTMRWIWNASLASYFGLPYGGGYGASKAALVNLAESLYPELKTYGVALQIINHGFVKTRLSEKNDFKMPELLSSEEAAQKINHIVETSRRFENHFPPKLSFYLRLLRVIPYRFSLAMTQKMVKE